MINCSEGSALDGRKLMSQWLSRFAPLLLLLCIGVNSEYYQPRVQYADSHYAKMELRRDSAVFAPLSTDEFLYFEGGTSSVTTGVTHEFSGLSSWTNAFLTVEIFTGDYGDVSETITGVRVNSDLILGSCDPDIECSGGFFPCVQEQDVSSSIDGAGALRVTVTASAEVNICGFNNGALPLYVRLSLASTRGLAPTSRPTEVPVPAPTSHPTSHPTAAPSISPQPSSAPSSAPTLRPVQSYYGYFEGGSIVASNGVSHTFEDIAILSGQAVYLTVEVFSGDYGSSAEFIDRISVNGQVLSSNCARSGGSECTGKFFVCISEQNVGAFVDIEGGTLTVFVRGTAAVGECPFNGQFALYTRLTLATGPGLEPTSVPSSAPSCVPSTRPSSQPTSSPTISLPPTPHPSALPTVVPTAAPSAPPTSAPSTSPAPTSSPTAQASSVYYGFFEGGAELAQDGVRHTFADIAADFLGPLYLTVEVFAGDFGASGEFVSLISANLLTLTTRCDPNLECTDEFVVCVDKVDVSEQIEKPAASAGESGFATLRVEVVGTDLVNAHCGVDGVFALFVRITLSTEGDLRPTSLPSAQPTAYPSARPSSSPSAAPTGSMRPTSSPSSAPSAAPSVSFHPTQLYYSFFEGGTADVQAGVQHTFSGIELQGAQELFLTVEVFAGDFGDSASEAITDVLVNGEQILVQDSADGVAGRCVPELECAGSFFVCVEEANVAQWVDRASGTLTVDVRATAAVNVCGFNDNEFPLYVHLTLAVRAGLEPTSMPSDSSSVYFDFFAGGTRDVLLGVSHTFRNIAQNMNPLLLTVELYSGDFGSSTESAFIGVLDSAGSVLRVDACDPQLECADTFFTCWSLVDVTELVEYPGGDTEDARDATGTLTVRVIGTSGVNVCGFGPQEDLIYTQMTLATSAGLEPTSMPSLSPKTFFAVFEGGTANVENGVSHTFSGISMENRILYLSVDVYVGDFSAAEERVTLISANSQTLSSNCNPNAECTDTFFNCLEDRTVGDLVAFSDSNDGILTVVVKASAEVNRCGFNGGADILFVKMRLSSEANGTAIPSSLPTTAAPSLVSPTSSPTSTNFEFVQENGTDNVAQGVQTVFNGFRSDGSRVLLLTVEVLVGDFAGSAKFVDSITVNGASISTRCDPGAHCTGAFFTCVDGVDVTQLVDSNDSGAEIVVSVTATAEVGSCGLTSSEIETEWSGSDVEMEIKTERRNEHVKESGKGIRSSSGEASRNLASTLATSNRLHVRVSLADLSSSLFSPVESSSTSSAGIDPTVVAVPIVVFVCAVAAYLVYRMHRGGKVCVDEPEFSPTIEPSAPPAAAFHSAAAAAANTGLAGVDQHNIAASTVQPVPLAVVVGVERENSRGEFGMEEVYIDESGIPQSAGSNPASGVRDGWGAGWRGSRGRAGSSGRHRSNRILSSQMPDAATDARSGAGVGVRGEASLEPAGMVAAPVYAERYRVSNRHHHGDGNDGDGDFDDAIGGFGGDVEEAEGGVEGEEESVVFAAVAQLVSSPEEEEAHLAARTMDSMAQLAITGTATTHDDSVWEDAAQQHQQEEGNRQRQRQGQGLGQGRSRQLPPLATSARVIDGPTPSEVLLSSAARLPTASSVQPTLHQSSPQQGDQY